VAVSLAAISPDLAVSAATSIVLLGFGVWNWRRERRHPVTRPVSTVVASVPATPAAPPSVMD
jgi:hypothetical protein